MDQLPPVIADMAFNKPQLEEFVSQIDGELAKLSTKLRTIADSKEEMFFVTLKQKLEETKKHYTTLKVEKNEEKLLKDLQDEKVELLKERAVVLEDTVQKSFKVQQCKNTLQSYISKNDDLEAELGFLVKQLAKPSIKAPELDTYLIKLESIEKNILQPKKADNSNTDKPQNLDIITLRTNQAKNHTLKAEKNIKMLENLKKQKIVKRKPRNDVYILDDIFNEVLGEYLTKCKRSVSDLKGKQKEELFEMFLERDDAKEYLYELIINKYRDGSYDEI